MVKIAVRIKVFFLSSPLLMDLGHNLCMVGELAGGGSVAVAVGVSDM